jgi:hypothetical protein
MTNKEFAVDNPEFEKYQLDREWLSKVDFDKAGITAEDFNNKLGAYEEVNNIRQLTEDESYKNRLMALEDLLAEKCGMFVEWFTDSIGLPRDEENPAFFIDVFAIKEIAERYFRDVKRIHQFHKGIKYIDCHKICGYIAYWIAKLRPITVLQQNLYRSLDGKCAKKLKYVNERFALIFAVGRINEHLKDSGKRIFLQKLKSNEPESDFLDTFVYNLKYRQTNGDGLAMTFYFVECTAASTIPENKKLANAPS